MLVSRVSIVTVDVLQHADVAVDVLLKDSVDVRDFSDEDAARHHDSVSFLYDGKDFVNRDVFETVEGDDGSVGVRLDRPGCLHEIEDEVDARVMPPVVVVNDPVGCVHR